jgi:hypothetical protein
MQSAGQALTCIYQALSLQRDHEIGMRLWAMLDAEEKAQANAR